MSNFTIMCDTYKLCKENEDLNNSLNESIKNQYIVYESDEISIKRIFTHKSKIIVSKKRSFEAAKEYKGLKTVVLNFANNSSIGGNPFYANAQEEALCRCSTLLHCLEAVKNEFYFKHQNDYQNKLLDDFGNDDLIYTPNITVFKSDTTSPELMPRDEWYNVDIITCAAPFAVFDKVSKSPNLENIIRKRIKRILDIAHINKAEVLILGAFGCGAYNNPPALVAKVFKELIKNYNFKIVEFAVYVGSDTTNYDVFNEILMK